MTPDFWIGFAVGSAVFLCLGLGALSRSLAWHRETALDALETAKSYNARLTAMLAARTGGA